ncbi:MAG: hypothetical protein NWE76_06195 [Candidatus Bathyarchaeota archaeon]|nr:hypothetical protein [Candidatus Bathyarchaeota archaeon]
MPIQRLRTIINELWARYQVFRVVLVVSFLVSITAVSIYIIYTLCRIGLIHFFFVVFVLLLLGIQRGIFNRIVRALRKN